MSSSCLRLTVRTEIASDCVLETAYAWLCKRRKDYPDHADVWALRFNWSSEKPRIQQELLLGIYTFTPMSVVRNREGETLHVFAARDALVLKALASVLSRHLPVSGHCVHIKGNGGAKSAVRAVWDRLPDNRFVFKTDVRSYYDAIDHDLLLERLADYVEDRFVLNLLWQYMHRVTEHGGLFADHNRGIPRGCSLSPVIAAFFLHGLDREMERLGLFYLRYMDDLIVLAPTRWSLRRAVKTVNRELRLLKLEKHPDKTFIGRIERGFDFLGYHFDCNGLSVAAVTVGKCVRRMARLYERESSTPERARALETYVRRWFRWVCAGHGLPVAWYDRMPSVSLKHTALSTKSCGHPYQTDG